MTGFVIGAVLIANVTVTSYRSVPKQTKPTGCEYTSIGVRCNIHTLAVSQELLSKNGGPLNYGDLVYIEGIGFKIVEDCMNARWTKRADVWVPTYNQEKAFGIKRGRMWLIKGAVQ